MTKLKTPFLSRRGFLVSASAVAGLAGTRGFAQSNPNTGSTEVEAEITETVRRNTSSFRALDWRPYFSDTRNGAILVDIQSRALHWWSEDQAEYKLYPTSVPLTEDLTRKGRTSITKKVEGPSWRPTPAMKKRNPEWPDFIGPGPDNPMGTHAMHLTWQFYRIHGTHDTRKIGRRSSNGCIGLFNEDIADLFGRSKVGTQVLLI
ncbi:MAG: L,D-transpeptidase [Dinoroseobacter sp.]|nr:L,D-transpeptidase [Dinoroseobacter sp.]MDJ0995168.1 L,D-transpeptidase [Dinoroseobacter sp.]